VWSSGHWERALEAGPDVPAQPAGSTSLLPAGGSCGPSNASHRRPRSRRCHGPWPRLAALGGARNTLEILPLTCCGSGGPHTWQAPEAGPAGLPLREPLLTTPPLHAPGPHTPGWTYLKMLLAPTVGSTLPLGPEQRLGRGLLGTLGAQQGSQRLAALRWCRWPRRRVLAENVAEVHQNGACCSIPPRLQRRDGGLRCGRMATKCQPKHCYDPARTANPGKVTGLG